MQKTWQKIWSLVEKNSTLRNLGIAGLIIVILTPIIRFVAESILQAEIQQAWDEKLKPYLFSEVSFSLKIWVILLTFLILSGTIVLTIRIFLNKLAQARQSNLLSSSSYSLPVKEVTGKLTPTDIINAAVAVRGGKTTTDYLIEIVLRAINAEKPVITPKGAQEILEEFNIELFKKFDGDYTCVKMKGGKKNASRKKERHS